NTHLADFSPAYYKDKLVFATNRNENKTIKKVYGWDLTPFIDLYYVDTAAIKKKAVSDQEQALSSGKYPYKYNDDDTKATSNDNRILGTYNLSSVLLTKDYETDFTAS